jgi:hypothetical protein
MGSKRFAMKRRETPDVSLKWAHYQNILGFNGNVLSEGAVHIGEHAPSKTGSILWIRLMINSYELLNRRPNKRVTENRENNSEFKPPLFI